MTTRTVYRVVRTEERICSLGEKHTVQIYAEKRLTPTGEIRHATGEGYSDSVTDNPVYADAQGRLYDSFMPIDYYAHLYYTRRDDKTHWISTPPITPRERYDETASGSDPESWPNVG